MRRIIDGKRYDTDTATMVADISPAGFYRNDFRYEETKLYRTVRGAWFIAGEGGPLSRWSRSLGQNGMTDGEGLRPVDADEARAYLEREGDTHSIEQYFADTVTDA